MSCVRPSEIAEMTRRRLDGQTFAEIGQAMGRHRNTVRACVGDLVGRMLHNRVTPGIKSRMIGLAKAGFTISEISSELGFSRAAVWQSTRGHYEHSHEARRQRTRQRRVEIAQAYAEARSPADRKRLLARFEISTTDSLKVLACQGRKLIAEARA